MKIEIEDNDLDYIGCMLAIAHGNIKGINKIYRDLDDIEFNLEYAFNRVGKLLDENKVSLDLVTKAQKRYNAIALGTYDE